MAKAMLIMDMPSNCNNCPLRISISDFVLHSLDIANICGKTKESIEKLNEKPTWCPLREVPQKKKEEHRILKPYEDTPWHKRFVTEKDVEAIGYNACIDEILGGGE